MLLEELVKNTASSDKEILAMLIKWNKRNFDISKFVIPKKYQRTEDTLFRGVELREDHYEDLQNGETVKLSSKKFSSWTTDPEVAKKFAHGSGGSYGVVIRKNARDLKVVISIESFFSAIGKNPNDYFSEKDEFEVIVLDTEKSLTISKDDLWEH